MTDPYITINRRMFDDLIDIFPPRLKVGARILWMHILWNANYSDTDTLQRGQICHSHPLMSRSTGLGEKTVRTLLQHLKSGRLVAGSLPKNGGVVTVLTIADYDTWTMSEKKVAGSSEKSGRKVAASEVKKYKESTSKPMSSSEDTHIVFKSFQDHINAKARPTRAALSKIASRLKTFSAQELNTAMVNISKDGFFQDHNAARPAAWFFASDERVETYLHKVPKASAAASTTQCPGCKSPLAVKTYAVGNPRVLPGMQGVPIYECARCGYKRRVDANGQH